MKVYEGDWSRYHKGAYGRVYTCDGSSLLSTEQCTGSVLVSHRLSSFLKVSYGALRKDVSHTVM